MWHRSEFQSLLANDADEMNGRTFSCHKYRLRPKDEWEFCAGWLLDQLGRGMPSIRLRIACSGNHEAAKNCFDGLTDGGHELWPTIEEMCAANGVAPEDAKLKSDEDGWDDGS